MISALLMNQGLGSPGDGQSVSQVIPVAVRNQHVIGRHPIRADAGRGVSAQVGVDQHILARDFQQDGGMAQPGYLRGHCSFSPERTAPRRALPCRRESRPTTGTGSWRRTADLLLAMLGHDGEGKPESAPFAKLAFRANSPALQFDQALGHVQAQSPARLIPHG